MKRTLIAFASLLALSACTENTAPHNACTITNGVQVCVPAMHNDCPITTSSNQCKPT